MSLKKRLLAATLPLLAIGYAPAAYGQAACAIVDAEGNVTGGLSTAETRQILSSNEDNGTACDILINADGSVTTTDGSAIIVDSSNNLTAGGLIQGVDADNITGIELQGGNTGDVVLSGSIELGETIERVDEDGDFTIDGPFAEGEGRTGILISGASPFVGNVTTEASSSVTIEGNDSYAFRIVEGASLVGNLNFNGNMRTIGGISRDADGNATSAASRTISIEGDVTGDISNTGSINAQGEGTSGFALTGNVTGGFTNEGSVVNTGYRFTDRQTILAVGTAIDATDTLQAGAALHFGGNVTEGVHLRREQVFDEDGVLTGFDGNSQILQFGSAPAILFDGNGSNINIGQIVPVTDTDNTHLQYAFVNQGSVTANALIDDLSATGIEVRDATLLGGINNIGSMSVDTFRSSQDGTADTAISRVVVLGSGAIVDEINNSGLMVARVSENTNEIYADLDNPLAAQDLIAVAIDLEAGATLDRIVNSGTLSAALLGRSGTAIVIRDASGSLSVIDNTGSISALGANSDPLGNAEFGFTTIAMDLSANTTGVTINQSAAVDEDLTDDITPLDPTIFGNILLGTGDDTVNLNAGFITGDIDFNDGADVFALSGGSAYQGTITNTGGLVISVTDNSSIYQNTATIINATSANFDATSSFRPTLDGQSGLASTLVTTGDITFADGATVSPVLSNVIDLNNNTFQILNAGGALNFGGSLENLLSFTSPYLYSPTFEVDPNDPNILLLTLDLRPTEALGLDAVQTASFDGAYDALFGNTELARAFVNITDADTFRNGLNQLLPEFAAASRHFVVANVDGAVGAVGSHLDNARRSQEQDGGAWVQEFTYFADRDLAGLSEQFRGFGFGFTGGLDTSFGPFHTAGVNFGFASTEIEDVVGFDEPLDVLTVQGGLYGGIQSGDFSIDLYGGGGFNDFDQVRNVVIGDFSETADASWSGSHLNASLRGGYDIAVGEKFWARPAFSIDYLRLNEDGYTETGLANSAIALDVEKRTSELAGATAMFNVGYNMEGRRTWIRPSLRVGYRNEFVNDGVETSYGFVGRGVRSTVISEAFPSDGFLLGFSVAAGTGYSSFGFDFDSDIRDGFVRHTGRVVLRMIF